jgi:glycosyltransferase involved in cell wall biosynthesis
VNRDVIFIALENWHGVWRRNQPVAAGLAARAPKNKLLFVGLPVDVSNLLRRRLLGELFAGLFRRSLQLAPGTENVYLLNCIKLLPNTLGICRAFNRWWERTRIRRGCRRLGIRRPLLWINPYYSVHTLGKLNESGVIYDVGDDWTSFPQPSEWLREQVVAEDEQLTRRADAVIVVSERLLEMKRPLARRIAHIPNGVYVERYAQVGSGNMMPHPMTRDWPRPVLAYTGSVHQDRVDIQMIVALARAFPKATVALIGPDMLNPAAKNAVLAEKNIRVPGPVDFDRMPQLMNAFDVCIVPHLVNDFTESLSPLKLYEYLAAGLPIVSTPVSGFRDFPELVHLASGPQAFIEAVKVALAEPPEVRQRRRTVAAEHSWSARLDEIEAVIKAIEPEPNSPLSIEPAHAV